MTRQYWYVRLHNELQHLLNGSVNFHFVTYLDIIFCAALPQILGNPDLHLVPILWAFQELSFPVFKSGIFESPNFTLEGSKTGPTFLNLEKLNIL